MGVVSICPGYLTTTHFHGPGIRGERGGVDVLGRTSEQFRVRS